ncbi:MAG: sialate O-acetylesterase [Candidatus Cryptobacteroides sp.]
MLVIPAKDVHAEIMLPPFFGENMVLQQNAKVKIWGKANAFTKLSATCSWGNRTFSAKADAGGHWEMYVETPEAGGPYEISFSNMTGGEKITINNVYIGEVWICSGQSNMVHPVRGYLPKQPIDGSAEAMKDAVNYKHIHSFIVPRDTSSVPQETCGGKWVDGSPENIAGVSANAYFFAKRLCRTLDVPVGIIVSSWGSSRIEAWMSEATVAGVGSVDVDRLARESKIQKRPSLAYNAMIAPIEGYTARGFIWCQLGANRREYTNYTDLLATLVGSWRKAWNNMDMPFLSLQGCMYPGDGSADKITYPLIIEKQYEARDVIENYHVVATSDIRSKEPHYPQKEVTGGRLAGLALKYAYGRDDVHPDSPDFGSVKFKGNEAVVTFTYAGDGMVCRDNEILSFELAGADRKFYPAEAKIEGKDKVIVSCPQVGKPVALRFAFHNYREVNLFNSYGLAPRVFRTDKWDDVN